MRRTLAGLAILLSTSWGGFDPVAAQTIGPRWLKGNLHTHSFWSDGDDYPEMIADWYRSRGYDFLAMSDHNTLGEGERWIAHPPGSLRLEVLRRYRDRFGPEWVEEKRTGDTTYVKLKSLTEYRTLLEEPGVFLLIQSEEISDHFHEKPVHLNAHNLVERIDPQGGNSVREVLQNNIDAVLDQREQTGRPIFPHVNHPNFGWAVTVEDLIQLEGERFFEVYNGHPAVNNEGDALRPSTERMWDIILAERLVDDRDVMYGLATDDSHRYHEEGPEVSNPGRGWIRVRAEALTPEAIVHALEHGDFYSTSGVELRTIERAGDLISIEIDAEPDATYRTLFIGTRRGYDRSRHPVPDTDGKSVSHRYSDEIGEVLAEVTGTTPSYRFRGDELYVRVKVISSKVKRNPYLEGERETAWTQPFLATPATHHHH